MKIFSLIATLVILLLLSDCFGNNPAQQGGAQAPDKGGQNQPPSSFQCNRDILHSYLLKGRQTSSAEKFIVCPDVKQNCCTKIDQQRIYHVVNDILPARLAEYLSKIKMALAKLKTLHQNIVKAQPAFTGPIKRRTFCSQQARKVYNFPFMQLYNTIIDELELTHEENKEHYSKFYCVLCDGENHPAMSLDSKEPKITFDMEFCHEFLVKRTDILKLLNVELVDYLVSLQNLVDCTHYVRSYNLNFFDTQKIAYSKQTSECLNFINGKNFLKYCKPLCERIRFSKITEIVDGDFEFIIDAVNLFEKFFEFKETGNFISMKLRLFFKKFVVPRTLSKTKKNAFLKSLKDAADINKQTAKQKQHESKNHHTQNKHKKGRKLKVKHAKKPSKTIKVMRQKKKRERKLFTVEAENPGDRFLNSKNIVDDNFSKIEEELQKTHSQLPFSSLKKEHSQNLPISSIEHSSLKSIEGTHEFRQHLNDGRLLAHKEEKKDQESKDNKDKSKSEAPKKIKPAKLVFDKELYNFYNEISISKPDQKLDHIFKIQTDPIDFDKPTKVFALDTGINPNKYSEFKFEIPKEIFYKMLFEYRKPDQPDPNLAFFLADFTPAFLKDLKIDLKLDYKIEVGNYNVVKPKKEKENKRVLAENPERVLIEDFAQKEVFGAGHIGL